MNLPATITEKWNGFYQQHQPALEKVSAVWHKIKAVCALIFLWCKRLRKLVLAAPVVFLALKIAIQNTNRLPDMVGLWLLQDGTYAHMVTREYAVFIPLCLTGVCLGLMAISRKTVYPWLISIFTLALPYLIYLTNIYAA